MILCYSVSTVSVVSALKDGGVTQVLTAVIEIV